MDDTEDQEIQLTLDRCQHQQTKKRDRADEKAGVGIYVHHQGAQPVL